MQNKKTGYIAGIARGHNAGVCLLKDGEIVFSIEEERLSRQKYDGGPYAGITKILDYTDKIDFLVISHTQEDTSRTDFSGDTVYKALARKLRLIDNVEEQVVEYHEEHHRNHAAIAFYRSGFETAASVIVDGAGTFLQLNETETLWETETIFKCSYPANFQKVYTHLGGRGPWESMKFTNEAGTEIIVNESAGIVKAYEAVTQYCGWQPIEAGKTMGLFPYGKQNDNFPKIYDDENGLASWTSTNRNLIIPTYPNGAIVNANKYKCLEPTQEMFQENFDITTLQNRRDMAYAVQTESQQQVLNLIRKAVSDTGEKNIVISGGYGLNCVANYWYLEQLKEDGINLYIEPISNDAGTAIGAAMYHYHKISNDTKVRPKNESLYLGPVQTIEKSEIEKLAKKYKGECTYNVNYEDVINIIRDKNIVSLFQERCENGPRALGNRSLMFDPTKEDGKDFVNLIKKREYFRPFAASVLKDDVHDWFDLRGMEESPSMMYAVNCKEGVAEKIPAVIHVDGTCRIQTVTKEQNEHWYNLISEFKRQTGVPALFNTSFNLGGEPLVETIDDAMRTLYNSGINYIYFPSVNIMVNIPHNDRAISSHS